MYVDFHTVIAQRNAAVGMLNQQQEALKQRCRLETEAQRMTIEMMASQDMAGVEARIDQSKQQALFSIDQQHAKRQLEIFQRAQEQRLQIETTASRLIMQIREHKLEMDVQKRLQDIECQRAISGSTPYIIGDLNGEQSIHLFSSSRSMRRS